MKLLYIIKYKIIQIWNGIHIYNEYLLIFRIHLNKYNIHK